MLQRLHDRRNSGRQILGFTLVELLVVIGIIAVLISILLPSLAKARQAALAVSCMSQQRQMGQALMLYAQGNQGVFPVFSFQNDQPPKAVHWWPAWYHLLHAELGGAPYTDYDVPGRPFFGNNPPPIFNCPASSRDADVVLFWGVFAQHITYGVNGFLWSEMYTTNATPPAPMWYHLSKISQVKNASECAYIMEMPVGSGANVLWTNFYGWDGDPVRVGYIHSGKRNVLYVDGHVEPITQQQWPNQPVTDPIARAAPFANNGADKYNIDPNAPAAVLRFFLGR